MIFDRTLLVSFTALSFIASPATSYARAPAPPPTYAQSNQAETSQTVATIEQALRATFVENPGLRAERASLRATQEEYPQAMSNFLPTLSWDFSMNGTNVRGDTIDGASDGANTKEFGLNLDQPIFSGGSSFAEMEEAKNNISAAEAALLQEEQDVFMDVITAYMNVIRDRKALYLQRKNEEILQQRLDDSTALFEAGELTRTDVSQSRARLSEAQSDRIEAELDLNATIETFENLTGKTPATTLEFPSLNIGIPDNLEEVQNTSINFNPTIIEARHEHLASLSTAQVEYGALLPQVSLNAGYKNQIDPSPNNNKSRREQTVGISVSVPFFQGGAQRSEVREAKIIANQYKLEMIQAIRDIMADTADTWKSYQSNNRIINLRRIQVESAREARDSVLQEVEAGERTYVDLLDADQDFLDAELNLLLAERRAVLDAYELLTYMGRLNAEAMDLNSDKAVYTAQDNMKNVKGIKGYMTFDPHEDMEYPLEKREKKPSYVRKGRTTSLNPSKDKHEIAANTKDKHLVDTAPIKAPSPANATHPISTRTKHTTETKKTTAPSKISAPIPKEKPDSLNIPTSAEPDSDFDRDFNQFYNSLPSAELKERNVETVRAIPPTTSPDELNEIETAAGQIEPISIIDMRSDMAHTPTQTKSNSIDSLLHNALIKMQAMKFENVSNASQTKELYIDVGEFDNYHMALLISHELKQRHDVPNIITSSSAEGTKVYSIKAGPFASQSNIDQILNRSASLHTHKKSNG